MIIIRAIAFLLHFTVVPVAIGRLITYKSADYQHRSPVVTYLLGMAGSLGLFFVLNFGFAWYQNFVLFKAPNTVYRGFYKLCAAYSVIIVLLAGYWICLEVKNKTPIKQLILDRLSNIKASFLKDKITIVYTIIFAALLLVQVYTSFAYQINEWSYDDYDVVVTSVDDINSGMITNVNFVNGKTPYISSKRVVQAWTTYEAYLSVVSSFDVTTVCHTILPVILLLLAYAIYYYMARFLFKETDNRLIFMILLSVTFIMGMFSHYSPTFRLLCALWQGKAVLTAIFIPFMICYMARAFSEDFSKRMAASISVLSIGACALTFTSTMLVSITVVVMFILMSVYHRKIYGIRYLLAGLSGPAIQAIMFACIELLYRRQKEPNFFYDIWNGLIS